MQRYTISYRSMQLRAPSASLETCACRTSVCCLSHCLPTKTSQISFVVFGTIMKYYCRYHQFDQDNFLSKFELLLLFSGSPVLLFLYTGLLVPVISMVPWMDSQSTPLLAVPLLFFASDPSISTLIGGGLSAFQFVRPPNLLFGLLSHLSIS